MKRQIVWMLAIASVGMVTSGCLLISVSREQSTPQVVYMPTTGPVVAGTPADLEARQQAASQITDLTRRDQAMARIATDAANAGQVGATRQALAKVADFTVRDKTAGLCAIALAGRGMRTESLDVARSITDLTLRDQTLAKLAGN